MKEGEEVNIDQLRADYLLVRQWWREADGWCEADIDDADDCIKQAVTSEDGELLTCWQNWLAEILTDIRGFYTAVRQKEARIRKEPFVDVWPDRLVHGDRSSDRVVSGENMRFWIEDEDLKPARQRHG